MKINWKVRFNNPVFWVQIIAAIIAPILAYFGFNWNDITTWAALGELFTEAVKNPAIVTAVVLSVWNAINDPTTKGLGDSARALTYKRPKIDNKNMETDNINNNFNTKKLFISQPMRGKTDEEILAVREKALKEAKEFLGDNVELIDSFFDDHGKFTPLECLGKSIELMSQADVVYFADGWKDARGCQIERMCASGYGKDLIDETAIE